MDMYLKNPLAETIDPYQTLRKMIEGEVNETLVRFSLDVANLRIKSYLNIPNEEYNPSDYEYAIVLVALDIYNYKTSDSSKGISSKTQGQRSISYNNSFGSNELSDEVKSMLPLPRIKLL